MILPLHPAAARQTTQVTTQVKALEEKERVLLEFCRTPLERARIQQHLKLRGVKHLRERYLKPFLAAGLLAMTDPAHPNAPTQKYRTTMSGLAALAEEP